MSRRRDASFESPSLVPMADMLTNTVGIMLFILIFASLSAGGVVISKHLPREKPTRAIAIWMYCSGGRIVRFDADTLAKQLQKNLGEPTYNTASDWARKYSAQTLETDDLQVSGAATADYNENFFQSSVRINKSVAVRRKANRGDDEHAVATPGSAFQTLLALKDNKADFFFFFVDPDSISLFRAARDQAAQKGFGVGWTPLGPGEPARVALSGNGRQATIQ